MPFRKTKYGSPRRELEPFIPLAYSTARVAWATPSVGWATFSGRVNNLLYSVHGNRIGNLESCRSYQAIFYI
jgi:hypothetical protein